MIKYLICIATSYRSVFYRSFSAESNMTERGSIKPDSTPRRLLRGVPLLLVFLALWMILYSPFFASAEIFSYVNKDGTVIITDQKPKGRNYRVVIDNEGKPADKMKTADPERKYHLSPDTPKDFDGIIAKYAQKTGLSVPLLRAVIKTESNFNPQAVSPKGAKGLMQLMPQTWAIYGVKDPFNPEENIMAGSLYFKEQYERFSDLNLAMAAYNAGPEAVEKYSGVPPYEETQNFVKVVNLYWAHFRKEAKKDGPVSVGKSKKSDDKRKPVKKVDMDFTGKLVRVHSGDKVSVMNGRKAMVVRLYGVDCPENGQPFSKEARLFTSETAFNNDVKVEFKRRDKYGRVIGEIILPDGRNLNHELLIEGLAWWMEPIWPKDRAYQALESGAKSTGRNIWSEKQPVPPWEWRKKKM